MNTHHLRRWTQIKQQAAQAIMPGLSLVQVDTALKTEYNTRIYSEAAAQYWISAQYRRFELFGSTHLDKSAVNERDT